MLDSEIRDPNEDNNYLDLSLLAVKTICESDKKLLNYRGYILEKHID